MQMLKKVGFISLASLASLQQTFAIDFGGAKVDAGIKGDAWTVDTVSQRLIGNVMVFLGILAVCYGLYGGFLIMTAGGEDDKVKKGKQILIHVALGLVVIYLANSIVQWVLGSILK